ncbi:hypothetical protein E0H77_03255 [Acinetobacter sp. ANC 4633]|nr:hypothetical protein E0H78_04060 [Acinetobacter sp. ANC 4641]TCB27717.1 hypothetical protein E0H77_03255 [Acinetobacter sp. ANC 4633]
MGSPLPSFQVLFKSFSPKMQAIDEMSTDPIYVRITSIVESNPKYIFQLYFGKVANIELPTHHESY